jgi:peptidoglycan/LPS O-acetylase OafA/YrhL
MQQQTATDVRRTLPYQPALDGVRGVAVAAVLIYHGYGAQAPGRWGSGGFLGVDVFFVLSGFLITSLLLEEHARSRRIALRRFWARRARRLLPALFVALALAAVCAALQPSLRERVRLDAVFTLLYVQNWRDAVTHSPRSGTVLSHTWSLAIEEQWYVVWPLLLSGLLACTRRPRALLAAIAVLGLASVWVMRVTFDPLDTSRAYVGTDARAHELLAGAALAVVLRNAAPVRRRAARNALEIAALLGAIFVVALMLRGDVDAPFLFKGGFALVALATALVLAAATTTRGLLARALSSRPLAALGLISYGVYLFHVPLFSLVTPSRIGVHGIALFAVRVAVAVAVAAASYRLVEQPIRQGTWHAGHLTPLRAAGAAATIIAALAVATAAAPPTSLRESLLSASTATWFDERRRATPAGTPRVLVLGEAQAVVLQHRLGNRYDDSGIRGRAFGLYGCGISPGDAVIEGRIPRTPVCDTWPDAFRRVVDAFDPHVVALLVGDQELFDRFVDGRVLAVGTPAWQAMFFRQLDAAREIATSRGARLVILTSACGITPVGGPLRQVTGDPARWAALNEALRDYAAARAGTTTLGDLAAYLCPEGRPLRERDGIRLSTPRDGLTAEGARAVWAWIAQAIAAAPSGPAGGGDARP